MTEQVNCPHCGHDRQIAEDTVCHCGAELHLTQSLREQAISIEAQIIALRIRQGKVVSEICRRERLRNIRAGRPPSNFWAGVIGKPAWAGQRKSPVRSIAIDMAAFD
jgi:hypothetical protein